MEKNEGGYVPVFDLGETDVDHKGRDWAAV